MALAALVTLPRVPDDKLTASAITLIVTGDPGDDLADLDDPGEDLADHDNPGEDLADHGNPGEDLTDHDDPGEDLGDLIKALERSTPPIRLSPVGAAAYCPFCKGTI